MGASIGASGIHASGEDRHRYRLPNLLPPRKRPISCLLLPLTLLLSGSINRCFEKHHGQCYCQRRRLPGLPLDKSEAAETRGESAGCRSCEHGCRAPPQVFLALVSLCLSMSVESKINTAAGRGRALRVPEESVVISQEAGASARRRNEGNRWAI